MGDRFGQSGASEPASDSPAASAGEGYPWHWEMALLWQQAIVSQQQWLLEWWLGLFSGALQPARLTQGVVRGSRQRFALARRQLGCIGAADLADAPGASGDQSIAPDVPRAPVVSATSGSSATSGGGSRRQRPAKKATPK